MKILLTGGTGMVGHNFFEKATKLGFKVLAPNSKELNLLCSSSTERWFEQNSVDMIIHTAGRVGGIQANIASQVSFLIENSDMARNLFITASAAGVKKGINLGSSCMYPKFAENPLKESEILNGQFEPTNEGYALAKVFAFKLCQYLSEQGKVSYKTILPCNIFGKYDNYEDNRSHMIPAVIKKIHNAKVKHLSSVEIWGDGSARREFMNVSDLADCLVYGVNNFKSMPDLMNVGTGVDYSILEYYKMVSDVIGFKGEFTFNLCKPIGMKQKLVDVSLAADWGWRSQISIEDGLSDAYSYFLETAHES